MSRNAVIFLSRCARPLLSAQAVQKLLTSSGRGANFFCEAHTIRSCFVLFAASCWCPPLLPCSMPGAPRNWGDPSGCVGAAHSPRASLGGARRTPAHAREFATHEQAATLLEARVPKTIGTRHVIKGSRRSASVGAPSAAVTADRPASIDGFASGDNLHACSFCGTCSIEFASRRAGCGRHILQGNDAVLACCNPDHERQC